MHALSIRRPGRREFLTRASRAGGSEPLGLDTVRPPRSRRPKRPRSASPTRRTSASRRSTSPRSFSAWRGSPSGSTSRWEAEMPSKRSPKAGQTSRCGTSAELLPHLDAGRPVVMLAGVHGGLLSTLRPRARARGPGSQGKDGRHPLLRQRRPVLLSTMLAYVGIDPQQEVELDHRRGPAQRDGPVRRRQGRRLRRLRPGAAELRARKIGRVIVDTAQDRPWSQYFCCMVGRQPGVCPAQPDRDQAGAARDPQGSRHVCRRPRACCALPRREALRDALSDRPGGDEERDYTRWRDANPEDTLRFYALRLHEVGHDQVHARRS